MSTDNWKAIYWTVAALAGALLSGSGAIAEPIKVLIVTGQHSHDWEESTAMMQKILRSVPGIEVDVSRTPEKGSPKTAWDGWRPEFAKYDCVIIDYNQESWPDAVNRALEAYVAGGGGLMVIHAAKNAFPGWKAYEDMVGLLWRNPQFGYSPYYDAEGRLVRDAPGEGPTSAHGSNYPWKMTTRDTSHPITRDFPKHWVHALDEFYHAPRSRIDQGNIHILLSGYSDAAKGGTGREEPVLWWIPYGKGKCLTNTMGHVMMRQPGNTLQSMQCVGFQVSLIRGVQWLATGKCSFPLPDNFPLDEVRLRELK